MDETVEEHESFGLAKFARISGVTRLFGSEFEHRNYIAFTISRAVKRRSLHREWFHDRNELIEVSMSEAQFVELITRMNMGPGVPVTLCHIAGKRMGEVPTCETERQLSEKEFTESCQNIAKKMDAAMARMQAAVTGGNLGKTEAKAILHDLSMVRQDIASNLPFAEESFAEAVEGTVSRAKVEIEAHLMNTVRRLGHEALQREFLNGAPVLRIGEKAEAAE